MEELVKLCRAMGDAKRLEIFRLLRSKNFCVGALARKLGITQSAVSQHLRVLREAGLVYSEKRGYYVHYYVQESGLEKFLQKAEELKRDSFEEIPSCPLEEKGQECCLEKEEKREI